jgi:hypothetical protein
MARYWHPKCPKLDAHQWKAAVLVDVIRTQLSSSSFAVSNLPMY